MRLALLQTHNGFRSLRNVIQITPQLKNGRFNFLTPLSTAAMASCSVLSLAIHHSTSEKREIPQI